MSNWPSYRSHRVVSAMKITRMEQLDTTTRAAFVTLEDDVEQAFFTSEAPMLNRVGVGDYALIYGDGYRSVIPAAAFETNYNPLAIDGIRDGLDDMLAFLNGFAAADPEAIAALIAARVPCNDALRDHPTVQCDDVVGLLGLLNGYFGAYTAEPNKGWGAITAEAGPDGRISFRRTR